MALWVSLNQMNEHPGSLCFLWSLVVVFLASLQLNHRDLLQPPDSTSNQEGRLRALFQGGFCRTSSICVTIKAAANASGFVANASATALPIHLQGNLLCYLNRFECLHCASQTMQLDLGRWREGDLALARAVVVQNNTLRAPAPPQRAVHLGVAPRSAKVRVAAQGNLVAGVAVPCKGDKDDEVRLVPANGTHRARVRCLVHAQIA